MAHPRRPFVVNGYPIQKCRPADDGRCRQRPQTGDDADQKSKPHKRNRRHRNSSRLSPAGHASTEAAQRRQNLISEARIALAPMAASSSMIVLTALRGTKARTATQSESASGEIVGDSKPGVISMARSNTVRGQS